MTDFEKVYSEYFNSVYSYIYRLSGNKQTAEDITSETFFKAMKAIDGFRGDCEIRVWLCQIAKNCYYSQIKKQKDILPLNEDSALSDESLEEKLIKADDAERIRKALHKISEPYREVFMWRVFAEMSFKQIGSIFSKSENWACVTYHRARKMIIDKMEENNNEK